MWLLNKSDTTEKSRGFSVVFPYAWRAQLPTSEQFGFCRWPVRVGQISASRVAPSLFPIPCYNLPAGDARYPTQQAGCDTGPSATGPPHRSLRRDATCTRGPVVAVIYQPVSRLRGRRRRQERRWLYSRGERPARVPATTPKASLQSVGHACHEGLSRWPMTSLERLGFATVVGHCGPWLAHRMRRVWAIESPRAPR